MRNLLSPALLILILACSGVEESVETDTTRDMFSLWSDSTSVYLPVTAEWTNRVEAADINGDGKIDLLFANGGNYSEPGDPEPCRVFINQGPGKRFIEATQDIFGDLAFYSRVVKVQDVNFDGYADIFVGNTFQTQSHLLLGSESGKFINVTDSHLPRKDLSVGDAEFGDIDGDGDLDIALADWGPGNNMTNQGGRTRVWINDGTGNFQDETEQRMPDIPVRFSWDLEFVDYDNDFNLDLAISCKRCPGSMLFRNNGAGVFTNMEGAIPAYTNNYDFESLDVDLDGWLDLITVNDGDIVNGISFSRREHVFKNNEGEFYSDVTTRQWPAAENVGEDDNNIVFLDYNSDRNPDFLISSLTGEDRLLENKGDGSFLLRQPVIHGTPTPHTLSMVVADINGDNKLDIVMGQGEGETDLEERIFIGTSIGRDTAYPRIPNTALRDTLGEITVLARVHDCKSPAMPHDFKQVVFLPNSEADSIPMHWYGEYLWRLTTTDSLVLDIPRVCATDAAGNIRCMVVR